MPVKNFPFTDNAPRLWVKIINNQNSKEHIALAKLDTGAGACIFPMAVAEDLDLKPDSTEPIDVKTVGKTIDGYPGTVDIDILSFEEDLTAGKKALRRLKNKKVYFTKDGTFCLLGSRGCMDEFILAVHYPMEKFSLREPSKLDCPCHPL